MNAIKRGVVVVVVVVVVEECFVHKVKVSNGLFEARGELGGPKAVLPRHTRSMPYSEQGKLGL